MTENQKLICFEPILLKLISDFVKVWEHMKFWFLNYVENLKFIYKILKCMYDMYDFNMKNFKKNK